MLSRLPKAVVFVFALVTAFIQPANAGLLIQFDGVASGASANSAALGGITFAYAQLMPAYDANGDEIPGSETWRVDANASDVLADDPTNRGFTTAPSSPNALDAVDQPVLMLFAALQSFGNFLLDAITFDNATFGGAPNASVLFLDANHAILGQLPLVQTGQGFTGTAGAYTDVQAILLPSGAFYDNLNLVPAPATLWLVLTGLAGLARRKKCAG